MSEAEMVPVTDEDRELAAKFYASQRYADEIQHSMILNGQADDLATVQLIAHHRLAAADSALERAATKADEVAILWNRLAYDGTLIDSHCFAKASASTELATAIRSLKEGASHVG